MSDIIVSGRPVTVSPNVQRRLTTAVLIALSLLIEFASGFALVLRDFDGHRELVTLAERMQAHGVR